MDSQGIGIEMREMGLGLSITPFLCVSGLISDTESLEIVNTLL